MKTGMQYLKADPCMLGLALADDNAQFPDEKFSLDAYMAGMKLAAHLWPELAAVDTICWYSRVFPRRFEAF